MAFPIDISGYEPLEFSGEITKEQLKTLKSNVQLVRDTIVFFTAYAGAKGLGGHTGGAYDLVPEALIVDGFVRGTGKAYPVLFDEAGHRVALQYVMAVLHNEMPVEKLLHYREYSEGPLPGHPEKGMNAKFSSGRLGHLWPFVNGVARATDKAVFVFGSDGSQQEGNDAEAARFCVANELNVKLLVDDNDVTITGHPSEYMKGYSVEKTLEGHGMKVDVGDPEDLESLHDRIRKTLETNGPVALVNKRRMAIGIKGAEGECKAHDVLDAETAITYLEERGHEEAAAMIRSAEKKSSKKEYKGSNNDIVKNRDMFGKILSSMLDKLPEDERKMYVIDSDLAGSTGLKHVAKAHPEVYVSGGIMERHNYSAAAGYGSEPGRQGVFSTFSAFSEMVISEIQMARLNHANVLAHFSHAGVDQIADNTCHYGMNVFFTDNGLSEDDTTRLYFPADSYQLRAVMEKVCWEKGLRFVFTTRSGVPQILDDKGGLFYDDYEFTGKDEVVRKGKAYVVSYGDMLYRALDAVERLREEGVDVGLINKPLLNVPDEEMLEKLSEAPFVLVVESQNEKTGLGVRYGTWLLKHGFKGAYDHMGVHRHGRGGVDEQIPNQGLDSDSIMARLRELSKAL